MRPAAILLAAVLSVSGVSPVYADREDDRAAIEALLWRYARALDTLNPEAYAAVYTPDGAFASGSTTAKGTEALKRMIVSVKEGREKRAAAGEKVPPLFHMTADSFVEFVDDTHARHHSYWQTIFGSTGPGSTPTIAAAGVGLDELVKINGEWFIQLRDVAPGQ